MIDYRLCIYNSAKSVLDGVPQSPKWFMPTAFAPSARNILHSAPPMTVVMRCPIKKIESGDSYAVGLFDKFKAITLEQAKAGRR